MQFFHTFGVRRTIDLLDSENQPGSRSVKIRTESGTGSGALGLTPKEEKKESL